MFWDPKQLPVNLGPRWHIPVFPKLFLLRDDPKRKRKKALSTHLRVATHFLGSCCTQHHDFNVPSHHFLVGLHSVVLTVNNSHHKCVCLQLELQSSGPSTPSVIVDEEGNVIDSWDGGSEPIQFIFEDIHWTSEISREEAARRLEVTFYPFKKANIHRIHYLFHFYLKCY